MLLGEDLRWRHERGLIAALRSQQHGEDRHHGLARPHVALQQAAHAPLRLHVLVYVSQHRGLCSRQGKRKALVQRSNQLIAALVRDALLDLGRAPSGLGLHELQEEELVVCEPAPSDFGVGEARGTVQCRQRLRETRQPARRALRPGEVLVVVGPGEQLVEVAA